jgi:pyruvate formate lyase activating enzyme
MKEAILYKTLDDDSVHCFLCMHHCRIKPGERGTCGVRENREGALQSLVWGRPIAVNVDPVEKKPLYHFHPGTMTFSLGTAGCNFGCEFCQNAEIAHGPKGRPTLPGYELSPQDAVAQAYARGCPSLSYTYTEPTIFMEYALDTGRAAMEQGLLNIFVSNGFMTAEAREECAPVVDAINVDLKSYDDDFYRNVCGGRLKPVLETIEDFWAKGVWVEVTTMLIPGHNDDDPQLTAIARFLKGVAPELPWHVSAFRPAHRMMDTAPTSERALLRAREIGRAEGLHYVYIGNVRGEDFGSTFCHSCGSLLVDRKGFVAKLEGLDHGACAHCREPLHGVGIAAKSV